MLPNGELETVDLADIAARVATTLEVRAAGTSIALHRACDALVRGNEARAVRCSFAI